MGDASPSNSQSGSFDAPVPLSPSMDVINDPYSAGPLLDVLQANDIGPVSLIEIAVLPTVYPTARMVTLVADRRYQHRCTTIHSPLVEDPSDYQRWFHHAAHFYGAPWFTRKVITPADFLVHSECRSRTPLLHHMFAGGAVGERIQRGDQAQGILQQARIRGFIYFAAPTLAHMHWWLDERQWKEMIGRDKTLNEYGMRKSVPPSSLQIPPFSECQHIQVYLGNWHAAGNPPPALPEHPMVRDV